MSQNSHKQRKAYVALLTLALGGLGVDRILLDGGATGPSETEASQVVSPVAAVNAPAAPVPTAAPTSRADTLAGRLDKLATTHRLDPAHVDDALRPPASWLKVESPKVAVAGGAKVDDYKRFTDSHKLLALVNNSQGGAAIINNQTIVLGKSVDGFTLVEVTKRSAIFEKDGRRVELALPAPAAGTLKLGD